MARRAALRSVLPSRAVQVVLALLGLALSSCGGSKSWSCSWLCNSNMTSGTHTYPDGTEPTSQCEADFGSTCNDFSCTCKQG